MESRDLEQLIANCPLRIRTNDGRTYDVEKPEFITVGDYTASILFSDKGVKRHAVISLLNIATVLPMGEPASP